MATARWQKHVYPHGPMIELGPGIWQVTGSLKPSPLPRNMQIWRAACGGLLLHSPVCLDEETMAELDALGPVKWIVAPCRYHRADALPFQERYPSALLLAPACAVDKVSAVARVDATMEDTLPALGITLHTPPGLRPYEVHLEFPLAEGTSALIMTDALFNLGSSKLQGWGKWVLKAMGSVGPLGVTYTGRAVLLKNKAEYRSYLQRMAENPSLSILCVAHGEPIREEVGAALRAAAQRV